MPILLPRFYLLIVFDIFACVYNFAYLIVIDSEYIIQINVKARGDDCDAGIKLIIIIKVTL